MKKLIFILLLLLPIAHYSLAQQAAKDGKYSMQKRQHKLEYNNPGDVSLRTYTHLKSDNLLVKPNLKVNASKKVKSNYPVTKKARRFYAH